MDISEYCKVILTADEASINQGTTNLCLYRILWVSLRRHCRQKKIEQAKLINIHACTNEPSLITWVDAHWDQYVAIKYPENPSRRGPKPKAKTQDIFRVLFLNLYAVWQEDPVGCLSFPRGENYYRVNTRYNKLFVSKKIIEIADLLLALGFIDQWKGSEGARKYSRIWPTKKLMEYFRSGDFAEFLIDNHMGRECIILRGDSVDLDENSEAIDETDSTNRKGKQGELDYDDKNVPFDIVSARELLQDYNALLRKTHIDISSKEQPFNISEYYNRRLGRYETRKVSLRHDNKFVRRIFYRGDWTLGGRYHGGWWQQIPSRLRDQILIDDQYTVEVDFSGFHISLAYGLEGHQPPDDPYALSVSIGGLSKEQQRKDVKLVALTAINAKDRKAAFSAFRDQRNRDQRGLPSSQKIKYTNTLLEQLLDNFLKTNLPISHYLCADKGVELMALDGEITTQIMKHFTYRGVPILTVHDSYIVESSRERELMDVMQSVTRKVVGNHKFKMKQEQLSPNMIQAFANQDKQINAMDGYKSITSSITRTSGYLTRYKAFQKYLEDYPQA